MDSHFEIYLKETRLRMRIEDFEIIKPISKGAFGQGTVLKFYLVYPAELPTPPGS